MDVELTFKVYFAQHLRDSSPKSVSAGLIGGIPVIFCEVHF